MKVIAHDLVPVYETDLGQKVVNGRELHQFLEVGKDFSTWMKDRIEKYGFEEGTDYTLTLTRIGERSNVTRHEYFLQLDAAKEVAMVENNDQGKKVRKYFIEVERRFKEQIQPQLPQNYKEALIALISEVEKNEQLEREVKQREEQLSLQAPKVALYDTAMNAGNNFTMERVSKTLGYGRNKLFEFLREIKVLRSNNLPYQDYIDRGYFSVRQYSVTHFTSGIENKTQTLVTPKGMAYIHKMLIEHKKVTA